MSSSVPLIDWACVCLSDTTRFRWLLISVSQPTFKRKPILLIGSLQACWERITFHARLGLSCLIWDRIMSQRKLCSLYSAFRKCWHLVRNLGWINARHVLYFIKTCNSHFLRNQIIIFQFNCKSVKKTNNVYNINMYRYHRNIFVFTIQRHKSLNSRKIDLVCSRMQ